MQDTDVLLRNEFGWIANSSFVTVTTPAAENVSQRLVTRGDPVAGIGTPPRKEKKQHGEHLLAVPLDALLQQRRHGKTMREGNDASFRRLEKGVAQLRRESPDRHILKRPLQNEDAGTVENAKDEEDGTSCEALQELFDAGATLGVRLPPPTKEEIEALKEQAVWDAKRQRILAKRMIKRAPYTVPKEVRREKAAVEARRARRRQSAQDHERLQDFLSKRLTGYAYTYNSHK